MPVEGNSNEILPNLDKQDRKMCNMFRSLFTNLCEFDLQSW